ncbi:hypothetical protein GCM10010214_02900 [Streptomyces abikoensis]|nr:hypothetical protein GCM10010214_02900 [Streptomyces abikoensis]
MFVLAAGEGGQQLDQGVGGRVHAAGGRLVGSGRGEGFPDGVADVGPGGLGEPAQVQSVVTGRAQALVQAADQQDAAGGERAGPLIAGRREGALGGLAPVVGRPAVVGVVGGGAEGGADGAVEGVGPQAVGVLVDQGPMVPVGPGQSRDCQ